MNEATVFGSRLSQTLDDPTLMRVQRRMAWITVCVPAIGAAIALGMLALPGGCDHLRVLLVLLAVFHFSGMLGITSGFHRQFAHRAFKASAATRAALIVAGSMAAQGPVIHWVSNHRRHHQFSDQPGDVHSPNLYGTGASLRGFWHAHIGWMFVTAASNPARYAPDLLRDPMVRALNKLYPVFVAGGLILPGIIGGLVIGSWRGALEGTMWGGLLRVFTVHHATWSINSITHLYGRRPYYTRERSRNNVWLALPTAGEAWHNGHHAFPSSARFGLSWWQFDLGYLFILGLNRLGLASDLNLPTAEELAVTKQRPASPE